MKQITGHRYATLQEQTYAVSAMGVLERLAGAQAVPLGSNDSAEWVLQLAVEAHTKINDLLGVYLKPAQLEALYLTGDVYYADYWRALGKGAMKEYIANPLLLIQVARRNPVAEVIYRMAYGTLHSMVPGAEHNNWSFAHTEDLPVFRESNHLTTSSRIDPKYLLSFDKGDLEKRVVVEVRLPTPREEALRLEWSRDGVWYGLLRRHPMHHLADPKPGYDDVPLPDLFSAILGLGFIGMACPFATTRWECNLKSVVPAGYGVVIPHDQINRYGALFVS